MKYIATLILLTAGIGQGFAQGPSFASSTLSFPVSDLEKATKWYQELLGEVESFSPAPGVIEFQLNEVTWLQLFEGELSSGAILRLEVGDINTMHKKVYTMGSSPNDIDTVPNVVSYFDFKDPDGNQLSFYKLETE